MPPIEFTAAPQFPVPMPVVKLSRLGCTFCVGLPQQARLVEVLDDVDVEVLVLDDVDVEVLVLDIVVVVVVHSVAPLQVPLVPQVQVLAVHAAMTVFLQAANAPPLNPDSAALPEQFLLLHGFGVGAAVGVCPNEGATLSQKRAATTVIVRVALPMTSSVLPRGRSPRGPG